MCATHILIMLYLSVKFHQICFSSFLVYEQHNFRHNLTFDLDLGHRNLTLVRNTPSHYVLSFCEVLLNLLQQFLSYC